MRTSVLLALLGCAALALFAHSPLLRAGLLPPDYAAVLGGSGAARAWPALTGHLWGVPAPGTSALPWRLETLLVLAGAALAGQAFLARLLAPWIGAHAARAAAWVSAVLVPLHPVASAAVAELGSRVELLALATGLLSGALFLSGRQDEREGRTAASLALLLATAALSGVALVFALALVGGEYFSVRRHRRHSLRVRTTATTLLVFGAAAALPCWLRHPGLGRAWAGSEAGEFLRGTAQALFLELGRVTTPSGDLAGATGTLLSGAVLLLALQPAFRAARNAPRLWGALFTAGSCALLAALLWATSASHGRALLATWVTCAALGVTTTALARPWRAALVAVVAVSWASLAHLGARPWLAGTRVLADLWGEYSALGLPRGAEVLVLDPPSVHGLPSWDDDLGWLGHPRLLPGAEAADFDPRRVRALSGAAFLAFVPTAEFAALRAREPCVVRRPAPGAPLQAARVPAPRALAAERTWQSSLEYVAPEDAPIDPLATEGVRLVAELATAERKIRWLSWTSDGGASGLLEGWLGERGARRVAEFDLSSALDWRLAGSVRRLEVEKGVEKIERGEVLPRLPELPLAGAPEVHGADWLFRPASAPRDGGGSYRVTLLALDDLEYLELPLEPSAAALRARAAQAFVRSRSAVAWALEYRIDGHVLARTRGRFPAER